MIVMLWPFAITGIVTGAQKQPFDPFFRHFQPFLAPETIHPLEVDKPASWGQSKPAIVPAGSEGRTSQCEPFRQVIQDKLQAGLSAQRIWQDLQAEHGFCGAYDSVKRFVRRLGQADPVAFRRMECKPGQEAQVDFGTGAPVERPNGRNKRPHVFRIVLSYSRKGYSEAAWHQDTENLHPLPGECLSILRWCTQDTGNQQLKGGSVQSRLV